MVFSSVTTPLLGLVDLGIVGHLGKAWFLSGVAIGSNVLSVLFFLFVFLRMSTVGLTGQAYGQKDGDKQVVILGQGILLALLFSLMILILQHWIISGALSMMKGSEQSLFYAKEYLSIRIFSAPATLINYVLFGWFTSRQNTRLPMTMILITNVMNIILDLLFVMGLKWQVAGVAWASLISEFSALIFAIFCLIRYWNIYELPAFKLFSLWREYEQLKRYFTLSRDIFLRSLCLQFVFTFFTIQGSHFGDITLAGNTLLLSLLMVVAYIVDGFSITAESVASHRLGEQNRVQFKTELSLIGTWCLLLALFIMIFLGLATPFVFAILTNVQSVITEAHHYLPWLIVICLVASWSYFLDGLFIGISQAKSMRNSMVVAVVSYLLVWFLTQAWLNHGLWFSFFIFMCVRCSSLTFLLVKLWQGSVLFKQ